MKHFIQSFKMRIVLAAFVGLALTTVGKAQTVTGSGTLNYVPKFTSTGSTIGNSTIFDNGNIGIGTTTPQSQLHLFGPTPRINLFDNDSPLSVTNPAWSVRGQNDGYFKLQSTADYVTYTNRLVIDANGNVGIGTSTPGSVFSILGAANSSTAHSSFGSTQWRMKINAGDETNSGTIDYRGFDAGALSIVGAGTGANRLIRMFEFVGINSSPSTNQALNVSGSGAAYAAIFQNGNVGIGTTTPTVKLDIRGGGTDTKLNLYSENIANLTTFDFGATVANPDGSLSSVASAAQFSEFSTQNDVVLRARIGDLILCARNTVSPTTGDILFGTGFPNTEKMRINNAGKVGIGTPAPAELLHVWGATGTNGAIKISSNNGFTNNFLKVVDGVGNGLQIQRGDATTIMAFDNTNLRVGIGTTTPASILHVNGSTSGDVFLTRIQNNTGDGEFLGCFNYLGNEAASLRQDINGNGVIAVNLGNGTRVIQLSSTGADSYINNSNNFGIGTTMPTQKLDVVGNIKSSGEMQAETIRAFKKVLIGAGTLVLENDPGGLPNSIYTDANASPTDLFIQSNPSFSHNTFINNDNDGFVAIGTLIGGVYPDAKLHVAQNNKHLSAFKVHKITCTKPEIIADPANCLKHIVEISKETSGSLGSNEILLVVTDTGNVGIGTITPAAQLEVVGGIRITSTTNALNHIDFGHTSSDALIDAVGGGTLMINSVSGKFVGIGCANAPQYMLDVNGTIRGKELRIELAGCDFVFDKGYKLLTLAERRLKVLSAKHLPNIAPAVDMQKGADMGQFALGLLQNVEEHEHYLYQQNDDIEKLKMLVKQQQEAIDKLTKQIEELKK